MDPAQRWRAVANASTDAALDDWLTSFADPQLEALVSEALANNPDLRIAARRLEQAKQHLLIAESAAQPAVNLFGTGGTKTGGGGDSTSALQALVLSASWELDLWGRVRYQRNAARESYASTQADFSYARQSLAAATAKAWFTATQLSLNAQLAAEMSEMSRRLQSFSEVRERVGTGSVAETAAARADFASFVNVQHQTEFARDQALRALEQLLGRYPAAEIDARTDLAALPAAIPVGVPLQTLERRPDIVAAERRVAAAFNRVGEAKAARLPQITLDLSFGAFDSEILELQQDYENPAGGLGARLLAPIYRGGALVAQVEIRTLEQQEATADYARIALRALGEVESALAAGESLAARAALLSSMLGEQARALELLQTAVRIGRADQRSLERQRLVVHNARLALLEVRADQLAQRVNLHLALGGSFEPPQS